MCGERLGWDGKQSTATTPPLNCTRYRQARQSVTQWVQSLLHVSTPCCSKRPFSDRCDTGTDNFGQDTTESPEKTPLLVFGVSIYPTPPPPRPPLSLCTHTMSLTYTYTHSLSPNTRIQTNMHTHARARAHTLSLHTTNSHILSLCVPHHSQSGHVSLHCRKSDAAA